MNTRPPLEVTLALVLAACEQASLNAPAHEPGPTPAAPVSAATTQTERAVEPAPAAAVALAPLPEDVAGWLADAAVHDDAFARGVLYSWTSAETVARMVEDRALFDDNELPEGPTPYVQALEYVASREDTSGRVAKLLLGHPELARRRYAWSRPWATRLGLRRSHGDQLIEIVLRPEAIIGRFDPNASQPWAFVDLDQRPVPLARVLAEPGRVAAIFHVQTNSEPAFREYLLCNEAALASWSLATEDIAATIAEDARMVRALAQLEPGRLEHDAGYYEALAFVPEHYRPSPDSFRALATALEGSSQRAEALRVVPGHRFDAAAAPRLVRVRQLPPRIEMPV